MSFIRNAWYVAMWAENLAPEAPQGRVILGEPIVFYRTGDGRVVALQDRCAHRAAPLHLGKVCPNGNLQCGYHGLQFNAAGQCVVNPHGRGAIPPNAKVRPYAAIEKHSLVWVWMGDAPPDPSAIPDLSVIDVADQRHVTYRDVLEMDAHYELVVDNLLDLSHTVFLHSGVLGNDDTVTADMTITQQGDRVTASRWMPHVTPPGLFDMMWTRDGAPVDHWSAITWQAPCYLINDAGVTAPGTNKEEGTGIYGLHLLTPVTERKTLYHFAAVRQNPRPFSDPITEDIMAKLKDLRRWAFTTQDEPMIEAQQRMLDMPGEPFMPAVLEIDSGPVRYKRVLEKMRAAERS